VAQRLPRLRIGERERKILNTGYRARLPRLVTKVSIPDVGPRLLELLDLLVLAERQLVRDRGNRRVTLRTGRCTFSPPHAALLVRPSQGGQRRQGTQGAPVVGCRDAGIPPAVLGPPDSGRGLWGFAFHLQHLGAIFREPIGSHEPEPTIQTGDQGTGS